MKIYVNENTNPYFNLASEEYLLEQSKGDIFLLWRNAPAVIIGKNQNAYAEINLDFTASHDIKVVRRLTGGGAVFHDLGNVNFTFISPAGGELSKGIREGGLDFAHFTRPVVEALASLGVKAELSGRNDIVAQVETPDGTELRKVSGNAQCVYTTASGEVKTMHHGTLLFSADMTRMQGALNVDAEKLKSKGVKSVRSRVANIADLLPADQRSAVGEARDFMRYIADFISARFASQTQEFDAETVAGIEALANQKYARDEWNLRRLGSFETTSRRRFDYGTVEVSLAVCEGRIANLSIGGDFFGVRDAQQLAQLLVGCDYPLASVEQRLYDLHVGEYIAGAAPHDIALLICTNNPEPGNP